MTAAGTTLDHWTARRARVYGSVKAGIFGTEAEAVAFAEAEIKKAGSVGRINHIARETQIVYFDIYPDDR